MLSNSGQIQDIRLLFLQILQNCPQEASPGEALKSMMMETECLTSTLYTKDHPEL